MEPCKYGTGRISVGVILHREGFKFSPKILFLALLPGRTHWGRSPELLWPPNNPVEKVLGGAQGSWEQSLQAWGEQGSTAALCPGKGPLGLLHCLDTLCHSGGQRASQDWHRYQVWGEGSINKQLTLLLLGSPASLLPAQEHRPPPKSRRWRIPHRCLQDNTPLA